MYYSFVVPRYRGSSHSVENGTRKISNLHYANTYNTLYKYDSHSVVLADLLYKTKTHYSEDHTMRIRTMRGPPVNYENM